MNANKSTDFTKIIQLLDLRKTAKVLPTKEQKTIFINLIHGLSKKKDLKGFQAILEHLENIPKKNHDLFYIKLISEALIKKKLHNLSPTFFISMISSKHAKSNKTIQLMVQKLIQRREKQLLKTIYLEIKKTHLKEAKTLKMVIESNSCVVKKDSITSPNKLKSNKLNIKRIYQDLNSLKIEHTTYTPSNKTTIFNIKRVIHKFLNNEKKNKNDSIYCLLSNKKFNTPNSYNYIFDYNSIIGIFKSKPDNIQHITFNFNSEALTINKNKVSNEHKDIVNEVHKLIAAIQDYLDKKATMDIFLNTKKPNQH